MAKRRTRSQKERARHQFTVSWKPEAKRSKSEPAVKRQFNNKAETTNLLKGKSKKTTNKAKMAGLGTIRHDIARSVFIASLILSLEVVIYFIL
ncbi:MAG: hypothetical protein ACC618_03660 [Patescibacteria group bacterium]